MCLIVFLLTYRKRSLNHCRGLGWEATTTDSLPGVSGPSGCVGGGEIGVVLLSVWHILGWTGAGEFWEPPQALVVLNV